MKEVWLERPHKCVQCGELLPVFHPIHLSHTLPKGGQYVRFKYYKKNFEILCGHCHYMWENLKHYIKGQEEWQWLFDKAEELKQEHNDGIDPDIQ